MTAFALEGIPVELRWQNHPLDWKAGPGNSLTIAAGEEVDWFTDPAGSPPKANAPRAFFTAPDPDFLFRAKVEVDFRSTYDAGSLHVVEGDDLWAKLCFEYSPQEQGMIVSVVTRGLSDDCNSAVISGKEVYLRISRRAGVYAFHQSLDGRYWDFVRHFVLGKLDRPRLAFAAQAPMGKSCSVIFSQILYRQGSLEDLRHGA